MYLSSQVLQRGLSNIKHRGNFRGRSLEAGDRVRAADDRLLLQQINTRPLKVDILQHRGYNIYTANKSVAFVL